jgi:hypothetical protein
MDTRTCADCACPGAVFGALNDEEDTATVVDLGLFERNPHLDQGWPVLHPDASISWSAVSLRGERSEPG